MENSKQMSFTIGAITIGIMLLDERPRSFIKIGDVQAVVDDYPQWIGANYRDTEVYQYDILRRIQSAACDKVPCNSTPLSHGGIWFAVIPGKDCFEFQITSQDGEITLANGQLSIQDVQALQSVIPGMIRHAAFCDSYNNGGDAEHLMY